MKILTIALTAFLSLASTARAAVCEIGEVDGGLAVLRDGRQFGTVWIEAQNFAFRDLSQVVANGLCSVIAAPCDVERISKDGSEGLAVMRNGKRVGQVFVGNPNFAVKDLQTLKQIGLCH